MRKFNATLFPSGGKKGNRVPPRAGRGIVESGDFFARSNDECSLRHARGARGNGRCLLTARFNAPLLKRFTRASVTRDFVASRCLWIVLRIYIHVSRLHARFPKGWKRKFKGSRMLPHRNVQFVRVRNMDWRITPSDPNNPNLLYFGMKDRSQQRIGHCSPTFDRRFWLLKKATYHSQAILTSLNSFVGSWNCSRTH